MKKAFIFTDEMNSFITESFNNGKKVDELLTEFNSKFNLSLSKSTIEKNLRGLGLKKYTSNRDVKINRDEIISLFLGGESAKAISEKLNINYKRVQNLLDNLNFTYKDRIEFRNRIFFNKLSAVTDLRILNDEYNNLVVEGINTIINPLGLHVVKDYTYEYNGKKFILDFYCPEVEFACVYNSKDNEITKEDGISIPDQIKIKDIISSKSTGKIIITDNGDTVKHVSNFEGLNIYLYFFNYNHFDDQWNVEEKIESIANKIISKSKGEGVVTAEMTEFKSLERIIHQRELDELTTALVAEMHRKEGK